ncbi:MAG TPA: hypothetical protein VHY09_11080 [Candidatus Methylacidiphilales bacterium]|nr:hypothetical protein [Candidatus Methylacidiphilales bacterium]
MNTKRKLLQLVDLRVQRYFAGRKGIGYPSLEREEAVESLTVETFHIEGLSLPRGAARPSAL